VDSSQTDSPAAGPQKKVLSREDILKPRPRVFKTVLVPEWEGEVIVQSLTPSEAAKFEAESLNAEGELIGHKVRTTNERLCILAVVDEHGKRELSDADLPTLMKDSNSAAVRRVADAAAELSGLDRKRNRKQVEDLSGNSDTPRASAG
jgi:hypothetical protein